MEQSLRLRPESGQRPADAPRLAAALVLVSMVTIQSGNQIISRCATACPTIVIETCRTADWRTYSIGKKSPRIPVSGE